MFLIRGRFSLTPLWRCFIILVGTIILIAILSGCGSQDQLPPTAIVQATVPPPTLTPSLLPPASPTLVPSPSATAAPLVSPTVVPATPTPTPTIPNTPTIVPATDPAPDTPLEGQVLVEALRRGRYVIAFRHTATDQSQTDTDRQNLANCQTQRNLSETGRTQAQAIGQAFQALQIPVGPVLSSPYCRTLDTAQLAFGRVEASGDLLNMFSAKDQAERDQLSVALQRLLTTQTTTATNTVLVTHGVNVQTATSLQLTEGEAIVVAPDGTGSFLLIARVLPDEWSTLLPADSSSAVQATPVELTSTPAAAVPTSCEPTPPDGLGPFYVPNAPERASVGQGHVLSGVVRSSVDCTPIAGAQMEFWLAGPDGQYSDAYRATILADNTGSYQFESNFPPPYSGRPSHIHLRVTAAGYQTLVTQYYPTEGQTEGAFDLVLLPEN